MSFENLVNIIKDTKRTYNEITHKLDVSVINILGCRVSIECDRDIEYDVSFYDGDKLDYTTKLRGGHWAKTLKAYYVDWRIVIENKEHNIRREITPTHENKRVYISFSSSALGDTLAWIPYVEEFRKKHNCEVICSTFHNSILCDSYENIDFIKPGDTVENIYAQYQLGWFYNDKSEIDYFRNPENFRMQPMQKTASDILGLEYKEIKPVLNFKQGSKKKKVGIATHSTMQSKYWNNPNGWNEIVFYLKYLGYEVVNYSREPDGYMGNFDPDARKFPSGELIDLVEDMSECEFFIGLPSGLSWVSWSIGLPTIIIGGFSFEFTEPKDNVFRVIDKNSCSGCFNHYRMDSNDWNWCPVFKGTERQFECSKNVTSEMVKGVIRKLISKDDRTPVIHIF